MAKTKKKENLFMFDFMEQVIKNLKDLGKTRSTESYTATLNSFKRFREQKDLLLNELNAEIIQKKRIMPQYIFILYEDFAGCI